MATSKWRIRPRRNPIRWMICAFLGHNYEWRRIPGNCYTALCAVCERLEVNDA